jgi:hypothetical protein
MAKLPYIQFFIGDWLKDPELSMCSPLTRGIWIDALCAMHERDRVGELSGTPEQLARVCRCSPVELVQAADELSASGAADVTHRNGKVTLINRRMRDEYKRKENTKLRVQNHRKKKAETELKRESNNALSYSYTNSGSSGNGEIRARGEPDETAAAPAAENGKIVAQSRQWIELSPEEREMEEEVFLTHLQRQNPKKNVRNIAQKLRRWCQKNTREFTFERLKGWVAGEGKELSPEFLDSLMDDLPETDAASAAEKQARLAEQLKAQQEKHKEFYGNGKNGKLKQ